MPATALPQPPRLIAIGGGKGGVGKTFLSSNLAVALARSGYRVVAVDTDIEGANLHTDAGKISRAAAYFPHNVVALDRTPGFRVKLEEDGPDTICTGAKAGAATPR